MTAPLTTQERFAEVLAGLDFIEIRIILTGMERAIAARSEGENLAILEATRDKLERYRRGENLLLSELGF
jgi:hypothetical protein